MSTLSQRVSSAAILVPAMLIAIFASSTTTFAILLALIALAGAAEWRGLAPNRGARRGSAFIWIVALSITVVLVGLLEHRGILLALALAGTLWWLVATVWVVRFEQGIRPSALEGEGTRGLVGWLILVPCWAAMVFLHGSGENGPSRVFFVLLIVWTADIGAFFVGRAYGRRKLAPASSPGKSWEGVGGGLVLISVLALAAAIYLGFGLQVTLAFIVLCLAVGALSVVGDLVESIAKRTAGVKDSGSLIPGHGGLLDRIDSLTACAPAFVVGYEVLGMLR